MSFYFKMLLNWLNCFKQIGEFLSLNWSISPSAFKVDFQDKLYLAPLTTVSPRRRSCEHNQYRPHIRERDFSSVVPPPPHSVETCHSAACANGSAPTSPAERWPCAPTCCRVSSRSGRCSRDTSLRTSSACRSHPLSSSSS